MDASEDEEEQGMQPRQPSGRELFNFLVSRGFRICEPIGGDIDNVVMSKNCDEAGGYVGVPIRQARLARGYLEYTLAKAGFTHEEFMRSIGTLE